MGIDPLDRDLPGSAGDDFGNSEFVFADATRTLIANEVVGRFEASGNEPLPVTAGKAGELLTDIANMPEQTRGGPLLVGAIPFDESGGLSLAVVGDVRRGPAMARALDPESYVFAVDARNLDGAGRRVLVGSSSELLVRKTGRTVLSNPRTGTVPRSADPEEDHIRATMLAVSEKELTAHRAVVDATADALRPFCTELETGRPSVVSTRAEWQLSTQVRGVLATPAPNALELAAALRPMPAACGRPAARAHRFIITAEAFDRRYFGGLAGWTDAAGDGEWVLVQRCAEIAHDRLRLYAGTGVVPASDPHVELAATSAKFQTFMSALGLDHAAVREAERGTGAVLSG